MGTTRRQFIKVGSVGGLALLVEACAPKYKEQQFFPISRPKRDARGIEPTKPYQHPSEIYQPDELNADTASKLVQEVQFNKTGYGLTGNDGSMPDYWNALWVPHKSSLNLVGRGQRLNLNLVQCLVSHGLFDQVFKREVVVPKNLDEFLQVYTEGESLMNPALYGRTPVVIMQGYNIPPTGNEHEIARVKLVLEKNPNAAKFQRVDYVLGDHETQAGLWEKPIRPLQMGRMNAFILERYQGVPSGLVLSDDKKPVANVSK